MEWMYKSSNAQIKSPPEIVFIGLSKTEISELKFDIHKYTHVLIHPEDWTDSTFTGSKVLIVQLPNNHYQSLINQLKSVRSLNPSLSIVVITQNPQVSLLEILVNDLQVFSILEKSQKFITVLDEAITQSNQKIEYLESLKKVKAQNQKLESLNENLEQLVHERTLKEFEANKRTEVSLKSMQWILSFIKGVARSETVEELMEVVRSEFKTFHSLMPPILMLVDGQSQIKFFYFQGKQFTKKQMMYDGDSHTYLTGESSQLRAALSNLFGRPFGSVYVNDLHFQSPELETVQSKIIFEHTLDERKLNEFYLYSSERWPIVNMALENILIKENLQIIAKQWARTFNEINDPIIIIDDEYRMSLSNKGYHKQINKKCYEVFAGGTAPCKECPIQKTYQTNEPQYSHIHLSGHVYRVHSYPIRLSDNDSVTHVINQYVEVTQSIDLQSKVIQGEKMAAVGLLAGNIAHELNNPLTGIFSLSGLLLDDLVPESNTFKDLTEVKDAAQRCQRIIKDLLDFTSVGSESKVTNLDLNEMVAKTLPLLKMAMRTINSDIRLEENPIMIKCNPQLFQQVIFNLVNNACQAMGDGGMLTVLTKIEANKAILIVRDTGPGIPDELKELIFDPFFTTKEEGKGTGLGLSMSRSVVERQGGRLMLNNEYSDGTEFIVEMPVVDQ